MKKIFKTVVPVLLSITAIAGLSSCSAGKASLLREPSVAYADENGSYSELLPSVKAFASTFGDDYFSNADKGNAVISPISVYMALSLAYECAAGDTKVELLSAIGADGEALRSQIPYLYGELNKIFTRDEKETGRVTLTNSIWYDSGINSLKEDCLDSLSSHYGAYSYQADFKNDNWAANKAVREFIKERTNNLIDCDWRLSKQTLIALINTLYIKDIWSYGDELSLYGKGEFLNGDNSKKNTAYYSAYYKPGKAAEGENCTYFYSTTDSGLKVTFIKPDEDISVNSVLNGKNITKILSGGYKTVDDEKLEIYKTRCIFPEFSIETDKDIADNLKRLGVNSLFSTKCNFSSVTDEGVYCDSVRHAAKLKVDKLGIEGAAVTLMTMEGSPGPGEYTTVYSDFILNRSFGVIVSYCDIPLFIGSVNNL